MVKQFFQDSGSDDDGNPIVDDDEEIDEDAAFTADDYLKYGDIGSKRKVSEIQWSDQMNYVIIPPHNDKNLYKLRENKKKMKNSLMKMKMISQTFQIC